MAGRHHLHVQADGLLRGFGRRLVSLGGCGLLIGGGSDPLAIARVDVPRTAAATYHHNGEQEGDHHCYEDCGLDEVSLTSHGALAYFACALCY